MTPRMTDHFDRTRTGYRALTGFEAALQAGPLEPKLLHLVKLRASQINGCAFCIQMHAAEALQDGETHLRLHMVAGWRDSPLFSDRERAGLAWTEALTLIAQTGAPDADWQAVEAAFSPDERAWLTLAIGAINLWNRVQVGLRARHAMGLPAERADAA
ncbi:carboxymuconolactone decarboxylase family protein [Paracoccus sp. MKU1]|uniref:carboxymuconolactone decarboxylase family protein n=1 Tax=Paracoccus sp. MKU1 TaxID=1745182 RepID=UPI0007193ED7|nr:carboxymuconolactone decarboxylase family protein [Paracoccus sp. MKU1]KRW93850.1 alkylhydroperoxidase [Paracoccus sp. MKU1]